MLGYELWKTTYFREKVKIWNVVCNAQTDFLHKQFKLPVLCLTNGAPISRKIYINKFSHLLEDIKKAEKSRNLLIFDVHSQWRKRSLRRKQGFVGVLPVTKHVPKIRQKNTFFWLFLSFFAPIYPPPKKRRFGGGKPVQSLRKKRKKTVIFCSATSKRHQKSKDFQEGRFDSQTFKRSNS